MTGRPGGAPFRFWGAARSLLEVSAQKARRREHPIARLLTPSLTRLTQDSCCAATSELTQDSWTHYRNSPSRSPRDGCHRATRVPSSSFSHSHGMWTKHANWGSMRGEGLCALRTRTQLLPFHEPARSFSCDARDRRMPLRVRFLSAMRVARRRLGLWRHCEPARVARFLHRSAAGPSSRTLKRKTACDADRSASHAVLGLTWTRLDSLSLSRAIPLDSLGTHWTQDSLGRLTSTGSPRDR